MRAYPYGYFGASSHNHINSHYTSSGDYMYWRYRWRNGGIPWK